MMLRRRDLRIHVGILEQILISRLTFFFVLAGIFVVSHGVAGFAIGLNSAKKFMQNLMTAQKCICCLKFAAFSEFFNDLRIPSRADPQKHLTNPIYLAPARLFVLSEDEFGRFRKALIRKSAFKLIERLFDQHPPCVVASLSVLIDKSH